MDKKFIIVGSGTMEKVSAALLATLHSKGIGVMVNLNDSDKLNADDLMLNINDDQEILGNVQDLYILENVHRESRASANINDFAEEVRLQTKTSLEQIKLEFQREKDLNKQRKKDYYVPKTIGKIMNKTKNNKGR